MEDYIKGYSYHMEIKFLKLDSANIFIEELAAFVDWLLDNQGLTTDVPDFFDSMVPLGEYLNDLEEEVELWRSQEMPLIEEDEVIIVEAYTDFFISLVSEIAENYGVSSIEVEDLISEEDLATEIVFEEDEYESSDSIGLESSFDDVEEF